MAHYVIIIEVKTPLGTASSRGLPAGTIVENAEPRSLGHVASPSLLAMGCQSNRLTACANSLDLGYRDTNGFSFNNSQTFQN